MDRRRSKSRSPRRKSKWGDGEPGPPAPAPGDAPDWVREMFHAPQPNAAQNEQQQFLQQALAMQMRPAGMEAVPTLPMMPMVATVEKAVYVDDNLVGKLIGKQGSNIDKMRRDSGSDIQFDKESIPGGVRRVVLSGTQAQVDEGELVIQMAVQDLMSGRRIGPSAPGQMASTGAQEPVVSREMRLEPPLVGAFIGPRGAHVSALREQVGVKLEVRNDHYSGGSADATILIGPGPEMAVQRAIQMVEEKIDLIRSEKASQSNFKGKKGDDKGRRGKGDRFGEDNFGKGDFRGDEHFGKGPRFGEDNFGKGDFRGDEHFGKGDFRGDEHFGKGPRFGEDNFGKGNRFGEDNFGKGDFKGDDHFGKGGIPDKGGFGQPRRGNFDRGFNGQFGGACDFDMGVYDGNFDDRGGRGFAFDMGGDFDRGGQFSNFDRGGPGGNLDRGPAGNFDKGGQFGNVDQGGQFGNFDRGGPCDFDRGGSSDFDRPCFDRPNPTLDGQFNFGHDYQAPMGNFGDVRYDPYNPDAPYMP